MMYFEQFYLGCLAHASYMPGSEGEAAVVDAQHDVELYLTRRLSRESREIARHRRDRNVISVI